MRLDRNNLFDFVRLYAALQVFIHHGAIHLKFAILQFLDNILIFHGVPIFFALSGFLVTISWINRSNENWKSYASSRFIRIFPALWVSVFISWLITLFLGKAKFSLSINGLSWLFTQASIFQYYNPDQLRDFGVGVINGSLWTIPVELQFYVLLPFLLTFFASIKKRKKIIFLIFFISIVSTSFGIKEFLNEAIQAGDGRSPSSGPLFLKFVKASVIPYLGQFAFGSSFVLLFRKFGQKKTSKLLIFLGISLFFLINNLDLSIYNYAILDNLSTAAIFVGIGLIKINFKLPMDISYGIYLYHMPLANMLIVVFNDLRNPQILTLYFLLTIIFSIISWFVVEKPIILKYKKALT